MQRAARCGEAQRCQVAGSVSTSGVWRHVCYGTSRRHTVERRIEAGYLTVTTDGRYRRTDLVTDAVRRGTAR